MEPVLWVEAHPQIAKNAEEILKNYPNQEIVTAALWDKSGEDIEFSVAGNEGSSSSLLELGYITASHPEVTSNGKILVKTRTLKEILLDFPNLGKTLDFLLLDTQGAEFRVIKGLGESIKQFKYVLSEVSTKPLYRGTVLFNELTEMMKLKEFDLVASEVNLTTGWGDALYIRRDVIEADNIVTSGAEHIKNTSGKAIGTRIRTLLIRIGVSNSLVSIIKGRTTKHQS
jgi:FkbM family methyltransferase